MLDDHNIGSRQEALPVVEAVFVPDVHPIDIGSEGIAKTQGVE